MLGAVELGLVLLGVVALPGAHGALATVVEVPLGCEPMVELLELPVPLFAVADVLPVDGVLLAVVDVPVLFAGVHGAVVDIVPVADGVVLCVVPVTDPALPATPGVPWVAAGLLVEVAPGCEVCNVPIEPEPVVEVVPVPVVEVVPV